MTCTFCGLAFDESGARQQCQGCLLAGGCCSVRCPRCGYEMPEEIGLVKRLRSWKERLRDRRSAATAPTAGGAQESAVDLPAVISLSEMNPGESGVIVDLRAGSNGQVEKCLALGILPGASITLRKRFPSFIFELGFSQFAVDEGMAGAVLIKLDRG